MNYTFVGRQIGLLLVVLSLTLLVLGLGSLLPWLPMASQRQPAAMALLITGLIGLVGGGVMWLLGRGGDDFLGRREALLLVSISWLLGAGLAALPFWIWANTAANIDPGHPFRDYVNCYFESVSGLTTTGATILTDIETLPDALLLWRAATHWFGGLGIVVLFVAVLPTLGVGGKRLFQVETPGPRPQGVKPRIRETAWTLWVIYMVLTVVAAVALRMTGSMGWFEAICHSFSMVSTGGLATRNASMGAYDSVAVDVICMVFMLLAGVSFAVFFQAAQGRWRAVWQDTELRVYLGLKLFVILVVGLSLIGLPIVMTTGRVIDQAGVGEAFRFSAFQTIALHSGTGYATADYDPWPYISRVLLVGLMFIGGCAGSTAGGVKVVRFWIGLKIMAAQLERMFRPNVVRPIKVGRSTLDEETSTAAVVYFLAFVMLFAVGASVIAFCEPADSPVDMVTAMTASIATLCNVGPGLGGVGATQNYHWFSDASKWVMSLLMVLGRLEVFTILVLFVPRFWRAD